MHEVRYVWEHDGVFVNSRAAANCLLPPQHASARCQISSSYAIAFFCPTILQELQNGITKIDGIRSNFVRQSFAEGTVGTRTNLALADLKNQQELLQSQLADLRDQQKVSFNKQNLLFLNSNQVLSAHRFVGSCENKFSLVADMLKTNPEIRSPSHISFG